ncbi:hypothetical protein AGLY_012839 [Aphis glycines]|uniref:Uncharacterized protein n=1 Tax=Aphis glycines TaxID=307491 RepID=A0A6G0T8Q1_APHGL|nr:hypothetical protein AGLY_012839 [Aphis glycines]
MPSYNNEPHHKENTNTWKKLFDPAVLRPFRLMMIYFFFKNLLCGLPLLPYLVAIFNNVEWTIANNFLHYSRYWFALSAIYILEITPISWILIAEIFPAKCKNILCNINTALFYVITFFITKYYPDYSNLVEFYNVFTINDLKKVGLVGNILFYSRYRVDLGDRVGHYNGCVKFESKGSEKVAYTSTLNTKATTLVLVHCLITLIIYKEKNLIEKT